MDFTSKKTTQTSENNLAKDCIPLPPLGESPNSIPLTIENLEKIFNSNNNNQNQSQGSVSCENDFNKNIKVNSTFQSHVIPLSTESTKTNLPQVAQQNSIFDNTLLSFLFKQNETSNGTSHGNDNPNDEVLKHLTLSQYKNESQSSLPIEQLNEECTLIKDKETPNADDNNLNPSSNDEEILKTIIENCSKQKNPEEEIFNAFAANIQLQSYFVQMMKAMMTNLGQDNTNSIPLLQQSNIIPTQNTSKEMTNDIIKNFQNNSMISQGINKKKVNEDEPLDLSNKNNLPILNINNGSANPSIINENDNNNKITETIRLQEQLIKNEALSLFPYSLQSQITKKSPSTTVPNKWNSPRGAANRRTYTQFDLEAAVNAIRSGKLGTRRASVVYGIPRSTLRNKIYKLESATSNPKDILVIGKKKKKLNNDEVKCNDEEKINYESLTESEIHLSKLFNTNEAINVANLMINKSLEEEKSSNNCLNNIKEINNIQSSILPTGLEQKNDNDKRHLSRENSFNKTYFGEGNTSRNSSENGDNSNFDGLKKSRPKRGQYRKYDKDALDEAVKSVRRGEMSVHRAGSFFGVPHSTLEYKVKERNLLRIKKRQKSFDEYNIEEKDNLIVEKKNDTPSNNESSSNVLTSLVTSWNMLSKNSENILASIASKSSTNK
uniref:HTH psq-type domain-containing protein n=1 Tax=Strongyloides stercoralis TaxID=6248 RepID=A0A0K0EGC2_STRER